MTYKNKWFLVYNIKHREYRPAKITREYIAKDGVPTINVRFLDIHKNKLCNVSRDHYWGNVCSISPYWQEYIDKYNAKSY